MRLVLALLVVTSCSVDEPAATTLDRAVLPPAHSSSLVAGTRSLVVQTTPDADHCGGAAITVRQIATPDDIEPELVAAMTIESPSGLNFTADHAEATARFDAFLRDAAGKVERANAIYKARMTDDSASAEVRMSAAARVTQILRRFADVLGHAEIPVDFHTGDHAIDKANAYCDALANAAEPLIEKAEAAAAQCRERSTTPGWWTAACAAR